MSENQPVKTDTGLSPVSLRKQPQRRGAREPEKKHTTVKSGGEKYEKDFESEKALGEKSVDCGKRAYKKKIFVVLAACRLPQRYEGTARQKSAKKKNGASDVKHTGHAEENQAV